MNNFGQWIREHRLALKMLQSDVAKRAGLSASYISTLERGQKHSITGASLMPDRDKVIAIAKAVNGDESEALHAAGYAGSPKKPENINELILQLQNLGIVDQIEFDEHDPRWQEMDFEDLKDDITLIIERTIRKRSK